MQFILIQVQNFRTREINLVTEPTPQKYGGGESFFQNKVVIQTNTCLW
jgi:hypothetical protein